MATSLPPFDVDTRGSGKFDTPWLRMQAAYWYAAEAMSLAPSLLAEFVVVVGELPPQPAASNATPAIAAAAGMTRRMNCMITRLL